jgi:nucleotide-binding universal stress UspA family protein
MAYKTILVHADMSIHAPDRIRFAASLARLEGGHLIGLVTTGVSRFMYPDTAAPLAGTVASPYAASLQSHARQALDQFAALAREAAVPSFEPRLVADDPEGGLVLMSRYADIVVLSQTDPAHQAAGVVRELPEFVMLNIARPVLLVPYAGGPYELSGDALVAWDGSIEAARAIGHALPLLRRASGVAIAQFESGGAGELAAQALDLARWLGRHGINATTVHEQHVDIGEGGALLSMVADLQAGLLVMGGYGHTRLRELLLGGVTRTMLDSMTVPVLMAH